MMGGDIAVASEPGRGSSFTLRVPLVSCEAPSAAELAAAPAVPDDTPPLHVLVAEDHPVNREFLRVLLGRLGHRVTLRENGQLAVEAAAQGDYDLVLMDLHMPVLDGLAAAQAIRALPAPRGDVLIVALTADAFTDTRQRAAQAGMNDFLTKPVQPVELQRSLARLFGRTRPADWVPAGARAARPVGVPATHAMVPADASPWLDASAPELMFEGLPPGTHAQLLGVFFDDNSGSIARLSGLLNGPASADLRNAAHAVRGAALSLGLRRVAATTGTIEALADASGEASVSALRKRFREELAETQAACVTAGWIERSRVRTAAA
jgi:CheY-like chemotaxis protein/HPt (histidine-containing phosphotransfer) domain-containing protein